jgi:deoxyribonuclease IV
MPNADVFLYKGSGGRMKIGCHISVAKGLTKAAQTAHELGAESFQVFTKNPRGLKPKQLNFADADQGRRFCEEHGITLIAHTPYITNLSTPKVDLHRVTVRSIREDLQIAEAYGAIGAVVHCGKHVGQGEEIGRKRMVETLNQILVNYEGRTKLLLENTAGQGTELGLMIEELVEIRQATEEPEKIGFCFDTCHGFAAGIWQMKTFPALLQAMKTYGYLPHLLVIHFNDSKVPYHSRKDRHEKIGKGKIGAEALALFLRVPQLEGMPIILETPVENEQEYAEEIKLLHRLRAGVGSLEVER